jgi:hypothetical protein
MQIRPYILPLLASVICASTLRADLPAARLAGVFPPGARIGTTVEVTVAGDDLDDLVDLRFSHPGIFARPATDAAGKVQPNRFVIAVGPSVPPGMYDARVVGRFGISNPRVFTVGDIPEGVEGTTNSSPGGATDVPVDSVVSGACAPGAADHFRFNAKQGQRVLVECAAREIDSAAEPVVVLTDVAGREMGRSRTGGVIDFAVLADGTYLLQVHDATFRGGPAYFYRLAGSTRPHIDFIVPPAGQAGARGKFVLYGRNLPNGTPADAPSVGGKALQQLPVEIELPAAAGAVAPAPVAQAYGRAFGYRLRTDRGWSNAVPIALTDAAPVPEQAVNDDANQPAQLTVPADVAGRFYPQRDRDWFTFDARKGESWWLEILSHRLGVPSDPFLLVQRVTKNDKGEAQSADVQEVYDSDASAGGADVNTASRDPAYRLEVKEDSAYRVLARDLFNTTRDDPGLAYVLSVRKEKPDFELFIAAARTTPKELPPTPLLRRGGAMPVRVVALRRDGFNGEIQLSTEGLPPGVTCAPAAIAPGSTAASLVLVAAENSAAWAGPLRVIGKAEVSGTPTTRDARGTVVVVNAGEPPTEAMRSRLTADFSFAVSGTDPAPLSIEPAEQKVFEAPAGGKVDVPLKLTWRAEPAGRMKLKAGGNPVFDNATESEVDAKAAAATAAFDLNKHKLPPGTHTLYVRAEGKVKYARSPEALKAATDAKAAAEKAAADAAAAAKQAAEKLTAARAGTDPAATKAAEKLAADADAAAKAAEQRKTESTKAAADLAPKDVEGYFYSAPIQIKVVPAK